LAAVLKQAIDGKPCVITDKLSSMYAEDIDFEQLKDQLSMVHSLLPSGHKISTAKSFAAWLRNSSSRPFLAQLESLTKLILTLPATNASSERSFSALKRLKTYLRNSMGQKKLNQCMLLHTYKEMNDDLDPSQIVADYVHNRPDRLKRISDK
jgi:hypothetical protein